MNVIMLGSSVFPGVVLPYVLRNLAELIFELDFDPGS